MWRNALVSTDPDGTKNYEFQYIQVTPAKPFKDGNSNFKTYLSGNYYDTNKNGVLDGHLLLQEEWSGDPTILSTPSILHPSIKSQTNATDAYKYIVEKVGAYLPTRDEVDTYLIEELTSLGTKGTIIGRPFSVTQFPIGGAVTSKLVLLKPIRTVMVCLMNSRTNGDWIRTKPKMRSKLQRTAIR